MNRPSFAFVIGLIFVATSVFAADPSPAEARLREALRNTLLQLRTAQNENAALQVAKGELDQKNKEQQTQIKQLADNLAADKDASGKTIANLNAQFATQGGELAKVKTTLSQTEAALRKTAALAQTTEAERARLAAETIVSNRTIADQKVKNAELYKLGREILLRYEKFGLGDVIGAKEPFVGTQRVKLETYVQDFQDKLSDQKIKP